jgi:xylulokinase
MSGVVVGIDSSTTACKVIAWDRDGRNVGEGRSPYPTLQPRPHWYEQNAGDWWESLCGALAELWERVDPRGIEALSITNQRESFVAVDQAGKPLRSAILWHDERSRQQLSLLDQWVGAERLHEITGKPLSVIPALPKILWFAQNEREIFEKTHMFLEAHAFLVFHLTGDFKTSLASADPMGLVDMEAGAWSDEVAKAVGLKTEQLPQLVKPGEIIGRVSVDAARQTGLPEGLPVVAGGGDGQCAGLGAGITEPDRAYLNMGTAVIGGAFSRRYRADRAFRTMYAPIPDAYYLETCLKGGVFTVGWFVERFARELDKPWLPMSPEELLEIAAAEIPPGSLGLMLVPYWHNVMSPYWDSAATGITIGWHGAHGPEHFYRAILEGIAFEQRLAGDGLLESLGQPFSQYVILGGGSRSRLWCQIMADVTGIDIVRSTTTEATCLGAGILAATAAGWYPDVYRAAAAMTGTDESFLPDPENSGIYDTLYRDVYKPLFPALRPLIDRLTDLTHP